MIIPIILSGGSGSRLWPLSRESYPKQFLPLAEDKTMLQMTIERLQGLADIQAPVVVCNEAHRFLVAEQLRQSRITPDGIMLESEGRNTAPAVAVAAFAVKEQGTGDELMLVLPADHVITDIKSFHARLAAGVKAAENGSLVTFGIVPDAPETGYGYIKKGPKCKIQDTNKGLEAYNVEKFVEKPDSDTAQTYLNSGEYYWNSGMFLFKATRYLEELQRFEPEMYATCERAYSGAKRDMDFVRLDPVAFAESPSNSIDYAVMERTEDAVVVPLDAGWSDVGSWAALKEVSKQDEKGNVVIGDVLLEDTRNSYLRSEGRLLAAVGVDDHIIVETADAVLVAHRDRVQDVKRIVEQLRSLDRSESFSHRRVYRPWGFYEGISVSERFQVKHIMVDPGASLSLQMHHHRAEHWVVVKGTARVTCGEEIKILTEDQSTYIPLGTVHRLENPGVMPLELIEVQTGSYLGEDDIVRFEDVYGRKDD